MMLFLRPIGSPLVRAASFTLGSLQLKHFGYNANVHLKITLLTTVAGHIISQNWNTKQLQYEFYYRP
jgi:hypothetical protein